MIKKINYFAVLLLLIIFNQCGYKLTGTGKHIPDYIKTIVIPDFVNKTTRYQAEQFVTSALRQEFIRRSKLILVDRVSKADSTLEGDINRFDAVPVSYSSDATANLYRITIVLNVRFIDIKTGKIIFENNNMSFTDTYDIGTGDFFSQETETLIKISKEFASSIVSTILENF
jgi:outer membrane lipopolysaccharide assembly protein LptE/RlpB